MRYSKQQIIELMSTITYHLKEKTKSQRPNIYFFFSHKN
ncbi:uncharacterized protein J3R85_001961 [Psidium guajava]|nr:uncharacterized protein J3R85_001961 [Psidium guajava]